MFRKAVAIALVSLLIGCASAATGAARVSSPQLADVNSHPILDISSSADVAELANRRVEYQVMVGPDGVADPATVRITGAGSAHLEEVFRSWLVMSRFRPATSNGEPVAALYKGYMEFRVR